MNIVNGGGGGRDNLPQGKVSPLPPSTLMCQKSSQNFIQYRSLTKNHDSKKSFLMQ